MVATASVAATTEHNTPRRRALCLPVYGVAVACTSGGAAVAGSGVSAAIGVSVARPTAGATSVAGRAVGCGARGGLKETAKLQIMLVTMTMLKIHKSIR